MNTPRWQVFRARDGWRWRLLAGNGRIIAMGEAHTRRRDAERAIRTVARAANAAAHVQRRED